MLCASLPFGFLTNYIISSLQLHLIYTHIVSNVTHTENALVLHWENKQPFDTSSGNLLCCSMPFTYVMFVCWLISLSFGCHLFVSQNIFVNTKQPASLLVCLPRMSKYLICHFCLGFIRWHIEHRTISYFHLYILYLLSLLLYTCTLSHV